MELRVRGDMTSVVNGWQCRGPLTTGNPESSSRLPKAQGFQNCCELLRRLYNGANNSVVQASFTNEPSATAPLSEADDEAHLNDTTRPEQKVDKLQLPVRPAPGPGQSCSSQSTELENHT
uniref:Uncharacterized protein n=1 Tax=Knipowitschia caucasica TaxID=637954 RepID=A0AAV2MQ15_KNICA